MKPCPFCGSKDIDVSIHIARKMSGDIIEARVICFCCNSTGGFTNTFGYDMTENSELYNKTIKESKKLWNTRV